MKSRRMLSLFTFLLVCTLCMVPALAMQTADGWSLVSLVGYSEKDIMILEDDIATRANEWPSHGTPSPEAIPLSKAMELCSEALQTVKSVSAETLVDISVLPYFLEGDSWVHVDGQEVDLYGPYWQMNCFGPGGYTVYMDAKTGEVLAIPGETDANG